MCDDAKERLESGRRCDDCLRRDVSQALHLSGRAGLYQLCVTARAGRILLRGELPSFYDKQLAQQIAMSVEGVGWVCNETAVQEQHIAGSTMERADVVASH